jgi:hypothetical protein
MYLPYFGLVYAHLAAGRFEETVAAASLGTQTNPRFTFLISCTLPSWAASTRAKTPRLWCSGYSSCTPALPSQLRSFPARYVDPKNIVALGNALRRAGLPEG